MRTAEIWPTGNREFTHSLINRQARKLLRQTGMPASELDEVQQQLTVDLWMGSRAFDPSRGSWKAFAVAAVAHSAGKIVRHRLSEIRDPRKCQSLSAEYLGSTDEPSSLVESVTQCDAHRRLGITQLPSEIHADLTMDLPAVTSTLPEDSQQLVELISTCSKAEVVQTTGIKRSTLNDRLRKVRMRLAETGIQDYFEISPPL